VGNITIICHIGNVIVGSACFYGVYLQRMAIFYRVKFNDKPGDFGIRGVPFKYWMK
jgi:hypothetical protein